MWYVIVAVICTLLGGWGGYTWGKSAKDKGEQLVNKGADWAKKHI